MADSLYNRETLREAIEGFQEFSRRFERIAEGSTDPKDDYIRALRLLPASDTERKKELAKFFQSSAGSKYSTPEREEAYNELLGRERNRENRG